MDDNVSMSSTVEPNIGVILDIKPAVLINSDSLVGLEIRFRPDSRRGLPAIVVLPFPPLESNMHWVAQSIGAQRLVTLDTSQPLSRLRQNVGTVSPPKFQRHSDSTS